MFIWLTPNTKSSDGSYSNEDCSYTPPHHGSLRKKKYPLPFEEEDEDPQDVTLNHGIEIAIEDDEDAEWDLGTGHRKIE